MKYANVIKGKYSKEAEVASVAAFEAGRIAMEGLLEAKSRSGDHNNNISLGVSSIGGSDLVTKYVKAGENYIFESLRKSFPQYEFIGEESSSKNVLTNK